MSNILITFEVKDNTTDNNLLAMTTVLSKMNTRYRVVQASSVVVSDIEWCEVYIANRPNSVYSLEILRAAKASGRYIVIALDDDIVNLPESHPDHWKRTYTLASLELGDALLSPNQLLLDDYCGEFNLYPILSIAFVKETDIKPLHPLLQKIRIVYPAGKDHIIYFNKYIKPFFDRFVSSYANTVDVTFIGIEPNVKQSDNIHFIKGMSYNDYLDFMRTHDFDIGIAPLDDDRFCARKYFAKYIEYSKYGILGLYSNVKPYTYAVKDGVNGLLVPGKNGQWEKILNEIVIEPEKIWELTLNAQQDLKYRYSLENAVKMLRKGCIELEAYNCDGPVVFRKSFVGRAKYVLRDISVKVIYHLRNDGISYAVTFLRR